MKVTSARSVGDSRFENVTFQHSEICRIKVGDPDELARRDWATKMAVTGLSVTLLGTYIFLRRLKA
jgi:hypothetical protein